MSKSHQLRKGNPLYSARLLGVGAVIVVTLTGCASQSNSAPAVSAPATVSAPSTTAATLAPVPSNTPAQAVVESTQAPANTSAPAATDIPATALPAPAPASSGKFKDGEYVGDATRADRWGNLQVRATVQGGQLVKIDIVESPHSTRRSILISQAAIPTLVSEAIQNQDAQVDVVSRATDTSYAFVASLESALNNAVVSST